MGAFSYQWDGIRWDDVRVATICPSIFASSRTLAGLRHASLCTIVHRRRPLSYIEGTLSRSFSRALRALRRVQRDLPETCRTGACVTKTQLIPYNAPQTSTSSSSVAKMVFCSSLAITMYVLLTAPTSSSTGIRAMILDHSQDKPHPVVVNDYCNRLSTSADSGSAPVPQATNFRRWLTLPMRRRWRRDRFRARRDLCGRQHQAPPFVCQKPGLCSAASIHVGEV